MVTSLPIVCFKEQDEDAAEEQQYQQNHHDSTQPRGVEGKGSLSINHVLSLKLFFWHALIAESGPTN